MPSLEAHRTFTAAPVECHCHADRAQPVPRFAAEALQSTTSHAAAKILDKIPPVPPAPPDVDAFTWLAVVNAAVSQLAMWSRRIENAKRRRSRRRPDKVGEAVATPITAVVQATPVGGILNVSPEERAARERDRALQRAAPAADRLGETIGTVR